MLPVLVLLLALGHACEWPAHAEHAPPSHATQPAGHDHADSAQISCADLDAVSSTAWAQAGPVLDAGHVLPLARSAPCRPIARSHEDSARLPGLPLFLLHASLLI